MGLNPAPQRIGAIFGDYVNNLESALDHLIYQLALASGTEDPSSGNYFPFLSIDDQARWDQIKRNKLGGIRDEWAERLKDSQPLPWGARAQFHPLVVLHAANKQNKHHIITPTLPGTLEWEPEFQLNRNALPGEGAMHDPTVVPPPGGWPLDHESIIGRARAVSPRGDLRIVALVPKEYAVNVGVGFQLGIPMEAEKAFPDLISYVRGRR